MAMEALAIVLGLSTFAKELHHRKVIVFSDNTAAEVLATHVFDIVSFV